MLIESHRKACAFSDKRMLILTQPMIKIFPQNEMILIMLSRKLDTHVMRKKKYEE